MGGKMQVENRGGKMLMHVEKRTNFDIISGEIRQGAKNGAIAGVIAVVLLIIIVVQQVMWEKTVRGMGFEPRWPIDENECQLPQFRNHSMCTQSSLLDSRVTFSIIMMAFATTGGMLYGALQGVVNIVQDIPPHTD
jgi:hypothetical protein